MRGMSARKLVWLLLTTAAVGGCKKDVKPEGAAPPGSASAIAAASARTASATDRGAVTFTRKPPKVGVKREELSVMKMSFSMDVDPGNGKPIRQETSIAETNKKTQELLALDGEIPTKVKVTFDRDEEAMTEGGNERKTPSKIAGKTYVVEAKDGKIVVSDAAGKLAPKPEATRVDKHFKSLGKLDPLSSAIPKTPLEPGAKVDSIAKSLEGYLKQGSDGMNVSDVRVTFKERSGDDGVFDLALKMGKEDETVSMSMDLDGEMRLSTSTGEPSKLALSGPITIAGKSDPKGTKMRISGTGTMSMSMTAKTR